MLNRVNKEDYICERDEMKGSLLSLFQSQLDSIEGDYVSYESSRRADLNKNKENENQERNRQLVLKNINLRFAKDFDLLSECLRQSFENLISLNHISSLKQLFDVQEDNDISGNIIPNYITFFIKHKLQSLLKHDEIVFYLKDALASNEQILKLTDYSSDRIEQIINHFVQNELGSEEELTIGEPVTNGTTKSHYQENKDFFLEKSRISEKFMSFSTLTFGSDDSKNLLGDFMGLFIGKTEENGLQDPELSMEPRTPRTPQTPFEKMDESSENGQASKLQLDSRDGPMITEKEQIINIGQATITLNNFTDYAKQLTIRLVGMELLRSELLKGLLEYHKKKLQDKKVKREHIKRSLEQLAFETHRKLLASVKSTSINGHSMDDKQRKCVLCEGSDNDPVCGRLIHLKKQEWIHVNCGLWSEGVVEAQFGGLSNVYQVIKKAKTNHCAECGNTGASIQGHSDANKRMHLTCALKQKCVFTFSLAERKISSMENWVKNNMSVYQKHYKNASILYFLFCLSMEMITSFEVPRRVYIQKKHIKGVVMNDAVKSDAIVDLTSSIREMHQKKSAETEIDGKLPKVLMSRIGNLIFISVKEATRHGDLHKTVIAANRIRQQYLLGLRKEGLQIADKYYQNQRDIMFLLLKKLVMARLVPVESEAKRGQYEVHFEVFELTVDLSKQSHIFTVSRKRLSKESFVRQMEKIYEEKEQDVDIEADAEIITDPTEIFNTIYHKMGFCYSEVRSYLSTFLKSALDRFKQNQLTTKNYVHFKHIVYQGFDKQQILLDVCEKSSIYDRMRLLFQVTSDLENSKEFLRDLSYIQEKQKIGSRSRVNPKSRSFSGQNNFKFKNSDEFRLSEKLINELAHPSFHSQSDTPPLQVRQVKRKANTSLKSGEKASTLLRRGFGVYKTQNTFVAPSRIHKYGRLQ